ncbi:MAG: glycosyl hydrolase 53 family protein, partial [Eubacterium sp.]
MKKKFTFLFTIVTLLSATAFSAMVMAATPSEVEDVNVEKVNGLSSDFIMGADISSIISLENAGVTFHDENGNVADPFKILSDAGVNYVRVRIWNDPYDSSNRGYGGGNCDLNCAIEIGKRAAQYGMKTLINFHYSDFWADPSRQISPKAWSGYSISERVDALSAYTTDSLTALYNAGVDIGMVQIGNETNIGIAGVYLWKTSNDPDSSNYIDADGYYQLIEAGCNAVDNFRTDNNLNIKIALHFTNPASKCSGWCDTMIDKGINFDVFGISYYPEWEHGKMSQIKTVINHIISKGKEAAILETGYRYSGSSNTSCEYTLSVQGQAD